MTGIIPPRTAAFEYDKAVRRHRKVVGMYPSMHDLREQLTSLHAISYSMVWSSSISGVIAIASRGQMRVFFCSGSKNHTIAHRYMLGGANIKKVVSGLL
ncbi:uncharacterized protein N7479_004009 [Penicillium vulpinum]|uniref:uncharacterized protein n=1 Tax=Penicillium vulpinum TaxID=29845 RepID=UPI0025495ECC|nr:uncharacterized protein N7479_004009 [Penicillium vulpinum]KAJ5964133.1 hypothetical protein N7479_004009 [Penicillium vulpinum]